MPRYICILEGRRLAEFQRMAKHAAQRQQHTSRQSSATSNRQQESGSRSVQATSNTPIFPSSLEVERALNPILTVGSGGEVSEDAAEVVMAQQQQQQQPQEDGKSEDAAEVVVEQQQEDGESQGAAEVVMEEQQQQKQQQQRGRTYSRTARRKRPASREVDSNWARYLIRQEEEHGNRLSQENRETLAALSTYY